MKNTIAHAFIGQKAMKNMINESIKLKAEKKNTFKASLFSAIMIRNAVSL
ncbi:hypothetical protein [Vibrio sp. SCSIO 43137]|nr:hypothetical protein [Vibrio sp. SCSIO 43137]WCE32397.1 hypothetical protein PK654_18060 [Vibrio sp. SCSIO 43137]